MVSVEEKEAAERSPRTSSLLAGRRRRESASCRLKIARAELCERFDEVRALKDGNLRRAS